MQVNKITNCILLLIFPLLTVLSGCKDDDEVMDTKLIKGQWIVVSEDNPEYGYIYDFTTQSEHTWSWGLLTTYFITEDGLPMHDKVYDWHVSDPNNSDKVYLDITMKDLLDSDDPWENTDRFIIEKLSVAEMILRKNEVGDIKTRIKLERHIN